MGPVNHTPRMISIVNIISWRSSSWRGGPSEVSRSPSGKLNSKKTFIRKLVLDVVKPHEPGIIEVADAVSKLDGVKKVEVEVRDYDSNIERLRLIVEGDDLDEDDIMELIKYYGGNVASVDGVTVESEEFVD